jgi:DNA-binding HxlR family transcriptional regulator
MAVAAQNPVAVSASESCPLSAFVNIVSGKWAIPILYRLIVTHGPIRFRELQRAARPITQKELTKQLRLLEARKLVRRTAYAEIPPRVEYEATPVARKLISSLEGLADWVREHGPELMEGNDAKPASTAQ